MEFMRLGNSKILYIMSGIPASGKSHVAKNLAEKEGVIYVSRDEIRLSLLKEEDDYFSKETLVFKEFVNTIQSALNEGKDVIADATHISRGSRKKLLSVLNLKDTSVFSIHVHADFGHCMARNSERKGREKVPEDVMISMYKNFSKPRIEEGFDAIFTIDNRFEINL